MRALLAAIFLCLSVSSAAAQFVTITAKSGATARVSATAASSFRCLIDKLEGAGYRIKVMGGVRAGSCAPPRHKHPCGLALDIDQLARDVTLKGFPRGQSTQFAKACGLLPGAQWRNADTGHFEIPGGRAPWPRTLSASNN